MKFCSQGLVAISSWYIYGDEAKFDIFSVLLVIIERVRRYLA